MPSRPVPWPTSLERFRALARTTAVCSGALLLAFHGWLFANQAAAGRLEDPWLLFRWLVALGLTAALVAIRRNGRSVWSRQGIAVWVLAALLHGPAVAGNAGHALDSLALPEAVATSILQLVTATALTLTLWMLAGLLARRDRHTRLYASLAFAHAGTGTFADGFSPPYSSRPPPSA